MTSPSDPTPLSRQRRLHLVKISHVRCGEADGTNTYVWAPPDWDEVPIREAVKRAQEAYLAALAATYKVGKPPNDYRQYGKPPYEKYPDDTVKAVDAMWAAKKIVWEEWHNEQSRAFLGFEKFLVEQGFEAFYGHEDEAVDLDWGHRHGQRIDYSETDSDTLPTPAASVGIEDPDAW